MKMYTNNNGILNLRYIRYSRKSSEAKERQALSIKDQNTECDIFAAKEGLNIILRFQEEKSAFKPNKRELFNQMLELIKGGEVDAILTWKPDRLCRNPEEGGKILQLLQDGILKEIRTPLGDIYTPDSDHLILQIHFGMANQFSRNLSQNVRRGLIRKIHDRKEYPRPAPIGYEGYGERGQRNIKPHPIESRFVVKAFEMASTGLHSLNQMLNTLHAEGFRTKKGKKISKSHLVNILKSPTYYGFFYHNGELCEGNYGPLITKGLYDLVQVQLKNRSRPKKTIWNREFVALIHCKQCGCAVTTSIKTKFVKSKGVNQNYIYHHCTHRRGNCKEEPVTDSELKDMLYKAIDKITIDLESWQLGLKLVKAKYAEELEKNKYQLRYIHQQQESIRDQVARLIEMRSEGELTKEEFMEQKQRLVEKLASLSGKSQDSDHSVKSWLELAEDFFNTAYQAREIIENGTPEQKQKVLAKIGENFLLGRKNLTFRFKKPYDALLKVRYRTNMLRD